MRQHLKTLMCRIVQSCLAWPRQALPQTPDLCLVFQLKLLAQRITKCSVASECQRQGGVAACLWAVRLDAEGYAFDFCCSRHIHGQPQVHH